MRVKGETIAILVALALASRPLYGQATPKRLSDWLLQQPASATDYPLGLSWRVPGEVPVQQALRLDLLKSLSATEGGVTADPDTRKRLHDWLTTLSVTGRVPVAVADVRWLQANPNRDPVIEPGHSVVLPRRPVTVTVIGQNGAPCKATHAPGYEAAAYLRACDAVAAVRTDWIWIAQPDGRVQRFGIAAWNREPQNELAPGAWVWAPARDSGWPERFSEKLIAFLATQGPAPDVNRELPIRQRDSAPVDEPTVALQLTDELAPRVRGPVVTASDWGTVGLLQTPTARMFNPGGFSFSFSRAQPYSRGNVFFQPLDWLEAGFRYSDISNRLYGPADLSGGQSYKDKGVDVKLRLRSESALMPQIAVGLRDVVGTGLFSGEYVVASKRAGNFDWSLGLGWGYFASQQRSVSAVGQGGTFSFSNYFSGSPKPFGGVQYHTPWDRLVLKLEYDSNNFQNEPFDNKQKRRSPVNVGLVYRVGRAVDLTLGVERGNTLMLGFAVNTQLDGVTVPKLSDPPRVAVGPARSQQAPDWTVTSRDIQAQSDWRVRAIDQRGNELRVEVEDAGGIHWRSRVDRVTAVLHRDAPASVDRFIFSYTSNGQPLAEHVVDRNAWVTSNMRPLPPNEQQELVIAKAPVAPVAPAPDVVHFAAKRPAFESNLKFGFAQTLGGPDAFLLYQAFVDESAKVRLRDDTWVQGTLRLRLADNYNKYKYTAPSDLPRVRTYLREYQTTSRVTVPNLQLTHVGKASENSYYSVYGGYLEEMYAGVGGEWLYRPFASRFAFGVDVNEVKQRDFRQDFGFNGAGTQTGYRTGTGHATLYWDTGWNDVKTIASVGRYLAKDLGATLQMSRSFKNGVTVGAYATRTNVSAARFGEGSFDKGIYLQIPFDVLLTKSSSTVGTFHWKPLTRDGGAKLGRGVSLYDMTYARDENTLKFAPAPPDNDTVMPADQREAWAPKVTGPEPYTRVAPKPAAAQWVPNGALEQRLIEALYRQQFRNIKVDYDGSHRLSIALANDQLNPISRAVGRAARTALNLAPFEAREIRITYAARTDPLVRYEFIDLGLLARYFAGTATAAELAGTVKIEYLNPAAQGRDPLARLDDLNPEAQPKVLTALIPETFSLGRVGGDMAAAAQVAGNTNWLQAGVLGAGLVLASSKLDRRADQFAKDHAASHWVRDGVRVGNALPWLGLAGSALAAFDGSDPNRSRTGFAATEAGFAALLASSGLKYGVGRARPTENLGNHSFSSFTTDARYNAFPSRHTSVAWAVATPFALEYDAPWLYGAAFITNLARVGSREHWVSDTVAGSLIGYGLGRIFWESSRSQNRAVPRVMVYPNGIRLAWVTD
jgi:membrane-associated phospholipid phosphatase